MGNSSPFSTYGRLAKVMTPVIGKTFFIVPASSALIPDLMNQFPVDEDGVPRVYADTSGDGFNAAIGNCVAGRNDRILVLPGAYTLTDGVTVDVNDITIEGVGARGQAVLTCSTADSFTVTSDGEVFRNLKFVAAATLSNIVLTGADNILIENCDFYSAVGGTGTYFIEAKTTANTNVTIRGNRFDSWLTVSGGNVTQTAHILASGTPAAQRWTIAENHFTSGRATTANSGTVTTGILFANAVDYGNVVKFNTMTEVNGATFTAGMDSGTSVTASGVLFTFNNFYLATAANAIVPGSCVSYANQMADGTV